MSFHLIHPHQAAHAEPARLPRERFGRGLIADLLRMVFTTRDADDEPDQPPVRTTLRPPAAAPSRPRPAHLSAHLTGHVHVHVPAMVGRILHRGAHPAAVPGLTPAAAPAVPAVPTAAGTARPPAPTGNALGVPLHGMAPIGRYLPGEDPRTVTAQLHALSESALAALDLHYQAVRDACARLDALAMTPLPSEQPPAPAAGRPPAIEYPPFATGARRAPAPMRQHGQELLALPQAPARHAGRAAATELSGSTR